MFLGTNNISDIDYIISDRNVFNNFLYSSSEEALNELARRKNDMSIKNCTFTPTGFNESKVVLARHLITPNHEVSRFLSIADGLKMKPLFFEYQNDKLMYKNPWKYSLGRMGFYMGLGKKGGVKVDFLDIINFNEWHGKPISEAKTISGESLVEFHHQLFHERFPKFNGDFFDGSKWYFENGNNPKSFYKKFLSIFINNGILFENFLLDKKEVNFTKEIILPAFLEILNETGLKPLIVALEPTEIESNDFWLYHPSLSKEWVMKKLNKSI